ncbi:AMP-binding protein [Caulobacter soli]|uniref:AMP-binding protein n=1 Tax=Caulobacter soli TaxID=2708539 RepID=UPI0013EB5A68|nr:AMP-binding protein [Caulobacter soli]
MNPERQYRLDPALDLAGLRALQLARLRDTLGHVYAHNAHYRAAFDAAGVSPDDLRALSDLARFPFTTKADLRANYPFGLFSVPQAEVARLHASSGTTGQPTVVGYTKADLETWAGLVARSIFAAGGKPGMKVHIAYGYGLFTGGLGAHYGAEAAGCTVIPMSGGQTEKQVQLILDFKPEIIMVTPSYMLAILDEFRRIGVDPRSSSLRIGIFGAEPWTHAMRLEIEAAFDLQAVDIYGLSEVMGPGVASEFAGDRSGPTIWEDHFLPEIIDPETGAVLPDGESGELVFTTLTKQAMPVIRYRTRDLTRLMPGAQTLLRRIDKIIGRSDDMLIIRGVNVFPSQIEELVLRCPGLAPHFEIELSRPGRLDQVKIQVEASPTAPPGPGEQSRLVALIKEVIGVTAAVEIVPPGYLPRSTGKRQHVRDLRARA